MTEMSAAKRLLAEATNAAVTAVPDDARIDSFERWDSLAHMRLLLALEEQIGHQLDPDESVAIESLKDIDTILNARFSIK
jgi:acyl carrier protein